MKEVCLDNSEGVACDSDASKQPLDKRGFSHVLSAARGSRHCASWISYFCRPCTTGPVLGILQILEFPCEKRPELLPTLVRTCVQLLRAVPRKCEHSILE